MKSIASPSDAILLPDNFELCTLLTN